MNGNGYGWMGMGMQNSWPALSSSLISRLSSWKPRGLPKIPQKRGFPGQILSQRTEPPHPLHFWGAAGSGHTPWCSSTSVSKPKSFKEVSAAVSQHLPKELRNRRWVSSNGHYQCLRLKHSSLNVSKTRASINPAGKGRIRHAQTGGVVFFFSNL